MNRVFAAATHVRHYSQTWCILDTWRLTWTASLQRECRVVRAEELDVRQATRLASVLVGEEPHVVNLTEFLHVTQRTLVNVCPIRTNLTFTCMTVISKTRSQSGLSSLGPTVYRGKLCQIPCASSQNSAAHRGKIVKFHGSVTAFHIWLETERAVQKLHLLKAGIVLKADMH